MVTQPQMKAGAVEQPFVAPSGAQNATSDYVWYVIVLLTVVNVFSYMDRMALSVLAPSIKADLQLSDAQLGLLTGLAFSLFYAICGIPIARWADRGVRSNLIALALTTWSVMTALAGAAQSFAHLFVTRVGVGAGEAGCNPAAQSVLCDYTPLQRRAGVFAVHNFGNYAGMMAGMVFAGWLGQMIGWRWTFVALGVPGIALAVIVKLTLREPVRGTFDARNHVQNEVTLTEVLAVLARLRTYQLLTAFYVLNGFVQYGLNQWWPSFYTRLGELSLSAAGIYLGLAIGLGSAVGSLLGGVLSNKVAQKDLRWPLIGGAGATLAAMPFALGSLFASSPVISILLVSLTALAWSVCNGPVIATINSVVPNRMRATAASLTIFSASLLGFGLGPFCVGVLSDLLLPTLGAQSLRYALLAPVALIPFMALVLNAAARALPRDLQYATRGDVDR